MKKLFASFYLPFVVCKSTFSYTLFLIAFYFSSSFMFSVPISDLLLNFGQSPHKRTYIHTIDGKRSKLTNTVFFCVFFLSLFFSLPKINFLCTGFPAAAYAAYAAGRGFSGYPSFGLPYPTGNLDLVNLHHHLTNNHNNHNIQNHQLSLHPLISNCPPQQLAQHQQAQQPNARHPFEHLSILHHNHPMHLWTVLKLLLLLSLA
jgi:hypothetical protein